MTHAVLETERLILRPPNLSDLSGWSTLMADEEASCFIGGPLDSRAAWASLAVMTGAWTLSGFANFSVIEKDTGTWIGRAGPWMPPDWPGPEIGWAFAKPHWGRGYAREATHATMQWARERLGWRHVFHFIHPDNLRSIALAQAVGSVFEGRLEKGALGSKARILVFGQDI